MSQNAINNYGYSSETHLNKLQMLEIVKADPMTFEIVIQRVLDGESLRQIAVAWNLPVTRFVKWIAEDDKRTLEYENALKVRADELVHDALIKAETGTDIARDKLVIDTGLKVAAMWDRNKYGGEKTTGGAGINIIINRSGAELPVENTVVIDG
jgi:hypothetical protein